MSDLISRQAAIERIEAEYQAWGDEYDVRQILGDLEDLPSAQPDVPDTNVGDTISRQAAIDALSMMQGIVAENGVRKGVSLAWQQIKDLPSAHCDNCPYPDEYVKEKEDALRWIPVSERLPNCNGCYLVWRPHFFGGEIGMPSICYFDGSNTWHDSYGVDFERILHSDDVVAWMPLPDPYKEEE